jgi:hypothetical protein
MDERMRVPSLAVVAHPLANLRREGKGQNDYHDNPATMERPTVAKMHQQRRYPIARRIRLG